MIHINLISQRANWISVAYTYLALLRTGHRLNPDVLMYLSLAMAQLRGAK